ncbi:MAG TPA: DUF1674 domain-containing protein [Rhizobium sp.]|nr:DUF1674 domain-containing protein [Rhizobium sp.]
MTPLQDQKHLSSNNSSALEHSAKKELSAAALRARQEAEERRHRETAVEPAKEIGGRGGPDPARFGDWEIKGRAIDF